MTTSTHISAKYKNIYEHSSAFAIFENFSNIQPWLQRKRLNFSLVLSLIKKKKKKEIKTTVDSSILCTKEGRQAMVSKDPLKIVVAHVNHKSSTFKIYSIFNSFSSLKWAKSQVTFHIQVPKLYFLSRCDLMARKHLPPQFPHSN